MKKLRPEIHFTPPKGWMNDPNGLVYYKEKYHLFYQHNPYDCKWDSMHWGHAVSDDLIKWEHLPIALKPDEEGDIFSGSCMVDKENVSGYGSKESPALLAFYTSHHPGTQREEQCLAISTDGIHFIKYAKNPIIPGKEHTPARDPFVFENEILGGYSLCITTEKLIEFYHSKNLLNWEKSGETTLPPEAFCGMIECPVLFKSNGHYVLMMSMDIPETEYYKFPEGAACHNRLMQYLVGSFDGYAFIPEKDLPYPLLVDEGCDFYAGTIFNNVTDVILMGWLGNSEKCMSIPTEEEGFTGELSYPRRLSLIETDDGYRLKHEFYPNPCEKFPTHYNEDENGKTITDSFICERISADGLKAETNTIIIDNMIKLIPVKREELETVWKMQTEAFSELLEKYKDYDLSPAAEDMDKIVARFEQPWTTYYFIVAEERNVGVIRVIDKKDGSRKRISPMWIMKEYRNKGYAAQAITEAESIYGSDHWCLDTILQEPGNLHLYEKMGYHRTGRIDKINERMDIVFYEKD